jgi:aldehyde dehydrogenase (NAD+)
MRALPRLSSAVFTRDVDRGVQFAQRVEAGMTRVADTSVNDEASTVFGGSKASGTGRFGGRWAVREFTTHHGVSVRRWPRAFPI